MTNIGVINRIISPVGSCEGLW